MVLKRAITIAVLLVLSVSSHKVVNDDEPAEIENMDGVQIIDEGESPNSQGASDDEGAKKKARKPTKKTKRDFNWLMTNYAIEMCILALFGVAFVVLIIGKNENKRVVEKWHKAALEELNEQFAYLGLVENEQTAILEENSYSEFTYYASGRKNCFYALFKYEMKKRHCILTQHVFDRLFQSHGDMLTLDMPVNLDNLQKADPTLCEFYMTKRSMLKNAEEQNEHFPALVSKVKVPQIVSNEKGSNHELVVLAEGEDVASHLIDKHSAEVLKTLGTKQLISIHITDNQGYNKYPLFIRARIQIGSTDEEHQNALALLQVVFRMLDRLATLKLSPSNRAKAEKNRKKIHAIKNKDQAEEKQNAILEEKRKADAAFNAKMKTMTPEQQRKLKDKQHAQELKKMKSKMQKKQH